jgi:hypothetical protein
MAEPNKKAPEIKELEIKYFKPDSLEKIELRSKEAKI